jgi:replicative DNA helicase
MRLPPQNIEVEEILIASVLANDQAFKGCEYLKPKDFYKTENQIIFGAMHALYVKKSRIDILSVGEALLLKKREDMARTLAKIYDHAPIYTNLEAHAKIIKNQSVKRSLLNSLSKIKEKIYSEDIEQTLDFAQAEIMGYKINREQGDIFNIKDLIFDHIEKIKKTTRPKIVVELKQVFNLLTNGLIYKVGFIPLLQAGLVWARQPLH